MKISSIAILLISMALGSCASVKNVSSPIDTIVETSCGICQFDMTGEDCALAVKINDKFYYVEGSAIDEHGDAHANDGLCNAIRKATVTGELKHGVFVATSFALIP